jgi:hypothetical protein
VRHGVGLDRRYDAGGERLVRDSRHNVTVAASDQRRAVPDGEVAVTGRQQHIPFVAKGNRRRYGTVHRGHGDIQSAGPALVALPA